MVVFFAGSTRERRSKDCVRSKVVPTWRRACKLLARIMDRKGRLNLGKLTTVDNAASNVARNAHASSIHSWRLCLKVASAPDMVACRKMHMRDMARELSNADASRKD